MNNKIKRNLVIVAVVLFVGAAAYLNWSYNNKWDLPDAQSALADEEAADPAALQQDAAAQTEDTITGTSDSPYFDEARLTREQSRDEALSLLQQAASAEGATQEVIDSAVNAIAVMAQRTMVESQLENTLLAKGFSDAVVYMSDETVTVAVSAAEGELTDEEVARITESVTSATEYPVSAIHVIGIDG